MTDAGFRASWWWIDRWRKSTAYTDMTLAEQGAYRNLLDECWLRGGELPLDERILAKVCGDALAWPEVREKVLARFLRTETGYRNETQESVMRSSSEFRERQRQKGLKSSEGAVRGPKGVFQPRTNRNQPEDQPEDQPDAQPTNQPSVSVSVLRSPLSVLRSPSPNNEQPKNDLVELALHGGGLTETQAIKDLFDYWRKQTKHERAQWTDQRRTVLRTRLREEPGTVEEKLAALKLAVDGALMDPLFNGSEKGTPYLEFENIFVHKGRNRIEKLQQIARRGPTALAKRDPKMDARDEQLRAAVLGGRK